MVEGQKVNCVLMISSDRGMFEEGTSIRGRIIEYAEFARELHIIVFAEKKRKLENIHIGSNVFVYPTNSSSRWGYIWDAMRIARSLRNEELVVPDVTTCQDPFETGWVGYKLKKKYGGCLQIQIHTDFLSKEFQKKSLLNRVRVVMAKRTLSAASCIRVVSKRIQDSLIASKWRSTPNIVLLPVFVDKDRYGDTNAFDSEISTLREKYKQFQFVILVVARLTKEKNIPIALRVLDEVCKKHPGVGMVIVGDGPEKRELEKIVHRLGLEDKVVFEPWTERIAPYYKAANTFLLTSDYEGYSMVLIEAMLSSCPVVATAVGVTDMYIRNGVTGFVCPVGAVFCLAEKVGRLVSEQSLRQVLAVKAKEEVLESLHNKKEYLSLYEKSWQMCCEASAKSAGG